MSTTPLDEVVLVSLRPDGEVWGFEVHYADKSRGVWSSIGSCGLGTGTHACARQALYSATRSGTRRMVLRGVRTDHRGEPKLDHCYVRPGVWPAELHMHTHRIGDIVVGQTYGGRR